MTPARAGSPGWCWSPGRIRETADVAVLRTGSRVDLGRWTVTFYREEYADHGRPFGGRIGGELGHQRVQPQRRPRPLDQDGDHT